MDLGEIYKVTCPDERIYIGQCVSYLANGSKYGTRGRWISHLSDAKRENGGNCRKLNEAIRKYGEDRFKVNVLLKTHISLLDIYEEISISLLESNVDGIGYNLRNGGTHSRLSLETRQIMSKNRQIKPCFKQNHSKETKQKISTTLINNVKRFDHNNIQLPKYVKYISWTDRKGYAIVSHPKCKIKYFVSNKIDLDQLLHNALYHLTNLNLFEQIFKEW